MPSYLAYGLGIHSDFPLPEFTPATTGGSDVAIHVDAVPAPPDLLSDDTYVDLGVDEAVLGFKRAGVFRIRGGREVTISLAPGADEATVRLYLVGRVMATLLYQRGLLVLHASAVEVNERAVAFMGHSCMGKSSVAAALQSRGCNFLADDVTALDFDSGQALAIPAFPQAKIDPDVARALGHNVDSMVALHPEESRRGLRLTGGFAAGPLPLALVYLLGAEAPSPQPLSPQGALVEFVRHSFPSRLLRSGGPAHLRQCAALARSVSVFGLSREEVRLPPAVLADRVRQDLALVTA
jgi:hypothetical protein